MMAFTTGLRNTLPLPIAFRYATGSLRSKHEVPRSLSRRIHTTAYRCTETSPGRVVKNRWDLKEVPADDFAGAHTVAQKMPHIHTTLKPSLLRPTIFAILCASGAYVWAAYETNEDTSSRIAKLKESGNTLFKRATTKDWPSNPDLAFSRRQDLVDSWKKFLVRHLGSQPDIQSTRTRVYTLAAEW